ncbi:MAG: hypothetical protein DRI37_07785, partial [Chloroflexi bacterium]
LELQIVGLWDFAWWVYQEVNFSPRIGEHCLLTLRTDYSDFFIFSREFALFAVDFSSTMRNPKEPKL